MAPITAPKASVDPFELPGRFMISVLPRLPAAALKRKLSLFNSIIDILYQYGHNTSNFITFLNSKSSHLKINYYLVKCLNFRKVLLHFKLTGKKVINVNINQIKT